MASNRRNLRHCQFVRALEAAAALVFAVSLGTWFSQPRELRAGPEMVAAGQALFEHEWQVNDPLSHGGDGLGPVFNAKSCVTCHFQGGVGGAGPGKNNILAFEVIPTSRDPKFHSGTVHSLALAPECKETPISVTDLFPIIKGEQRVLGGCRITIPDFSPVRFTGINTPTLAGAGKIDRLSEFDIRRNHVRRKFGLIAREMRYDFTGTSTGRLRVLADGRLGRFGWKAQFATLEEFVAAACANELGLTTPRSAQQAPRQYAADTAAKLDMNADQFRQLNAFIEMLPAPGRQIPHDSAAAARAERGEHLFAAIGCTDCHSAKIGNVAGIYSDLALHRIENEDTPLYGNLPPETPEPEEHPLASEWKTPALWGVADTAPYFHDGESPTLAAAILRHAGESRHVTARFKSLPEDDQRAVVAFLETLRSPPSAARQETIVAELNPAATTND